MKKYPVILIVLALAVSSFAQAPNGLAFLKITPDVRSAAMGETGAYAGNQPAISVNPAMLAGVSGRMVAFSHQQWIVDTQINYLQAMFENGYANIAFSALSTGVDDIEVRTTPSPQPESYIDSKDLMFGMTAARSFGDKLGFGITAKYIQEHIYYQDTGGFAVDFGAVYQYSTRLVLGASVLHLGKMSAMENVEPELPLTAAFGAAYNLKLENAGDFTLALGGNFVREEDLRGNLGVEYRPLEIIALRAGYLVNYDERGMTAGLGLNWNNLSFDYAYVPFDNDLGDTQKFGFAFRF
ncbi:MAG: PorV/PorQ family protein [FCB group bacterium]|nr:PorV/PorQ family protein [FCB group bacterium]